MTSSRKYLYIFISSTFNDMHAERNYLVRRVFPELSEWCEERNIVLREIDLRWGITAADSETKNTVKICLQNIDKCRPFFLCFLGQRRGWVPAPDDIPAETTQLFPGIASRAGKQSVTEMEITHALIDPLHNGQFRDKDGNICPGEKVKRAFFFLRDPDYLTELKRHGHAHLLPLYTNDSFDHSAAGIAAKETADAALAEWRDEIILHSGRPVSHYSAFWNESSRTPEIALSLSLLTGAKQGSPAWNAAFRTWQARWAEACVAVNSDGTISGGELDKANAYSQALTKGRLDAFRCLGIDLADVVLQQLKEAITLEFPENGVSTEEKDVWQLDLDQQEQFVQLNSEGFIPRPEVFEALNNWLDDSKKGTMLLSAAGGLGKTMLLANYSEAIRAQSPRTVYSRFCSASDRSSDPYSLWCSIFSEARLPLPDTFDQLKKKLPELLSRLRTENGVVIIIDGINQMSGGIEMLSWLPTAMPVGFKLLLSMKTDDQTASLIKRCEREQSFASFHLEPFLNKKELINTYLSLYLKALDDDLIAQICSLPGSDNPLFLKVLLYELRAFGAFPQLKAEIERFGDGPVSAFTAMLERLEDDSAFDVIDPAQTVPLLIGLIACARNGLSEAELVHCFKQKFTCSDETAIRGTIRFYLRQIRPYISRRNGRTDFLYEQLKIAACERYNRDLTTFHIVLAQCFLSFADPSSDGSFLAGSERGLTEYAWQLRACDFPAAEKLYCNIPYLNARCSCASPSLLLSEFDFIVGSQAEQLEAIRSVIFRHLQTLSKYPNTLPSILWHSGSNGIREELVNLSREDGSLRCPWIKTETIAQIAAEQKDDSTVFSCKILAELQLYSSAAALASDTDLGFYCAGPGKIGVIDTAAMDLSTAIIHVRPKNILSLNVSASGRLLIAAFEDMSADIIRISGNAQNLLAETVGTIRYYLGNNYYGVFTFEDDQTFWYQPDREHLQSFCLNEDGSVRDGQSIAVCGEATSLQISGGILGCSFWEKSTKSTMIMIWALDDLHRSAQRMFEQNNIMLCGAVDEQFAAASMSSGRNYELQILGKDLQTVAATPLDSPVSSLIQVRSQLLIIPTMHTSNCLYLWDHQNGRLLRAKQIFSYQDVTRIKVNTNSSLMFISNMGAVNFSLQTSGVVSDERILWAVDSLHGMILICSGQGGEIRIHRDEVTAEIKKPGAGEVYRFLDAGASGLLFASDGGGWRFDYADIKRVEPFRSGFHPLASAAGPAGVPFFYTAERSLVNSQNSKSINLQDYLLTNVSLYAFGNVLALTGVTRNQRAVNDRTPHIVQFYRILENGSLMKIGEQYFSIVNELILAICAKDEQRVYLFFQKASGENVSHNPLLVYGSITEILTGDYHTEILDCSPADLSASISERGLFVCSDSIVTFWDSKDFHCLSALSADEKIRRIDNNSRMESIALIGDLSAARITAI